MKLPVKNPPTPLPTPLTLKLFNRLRGLLTSCGIRQVPWDEEYLVKSAKEKTGLEDFGDEKFREPLGRLIESYRTESKLSPFGVVLVRFNLRLLLMNRLRMQEVLKRHPEILDSPIKHPFIIAGLPRTGTSLLYNLLAQDPANRPLLFWESLSPAPNLNRDPSEPDRRIRGAVRIVRMLKHLAPRMMSIHPLDAQGPEECSRLLLNTLVTPFAAMENHIPSYIDWYLEQPIEELEATYRDYYRQLQVLQWQNPPQGQWLLKSPSHQLGLAALQRVIPDARLILTHRDPRKVVPSACSLVASYQNISSERVNPHEVGEEVLRLLVEGKNRTLRLAETNPDASPFHLLYQDLMSDPIDSLRRLYAHFDCKLSSEAEVGAARWLKANPANKHGVHHYALQDFGLTTQQVEDAFADYVEHFKIAPERSKKV